MKTEIATNLCVGNESVVLDGSQCFSGLHGCSNLLVKDLECAWTSRIGDGYQWLYQQLSLVT